MEIFREFGKLIRNDKYFKYFTVIIIIIIGIGSFFKIALFPAIISYLSIIILYFVRTSRDINIKLLNNLRNICVSQVWERTNNIRNRDLRFNRLLESADYCLTICGLSLGHFSYQNMFTFSKKDLSVRLIFLNPYSLYAEAHRHFRKNSDLQAEIKNTINHIEYSIKAAKSSNLELKNLEIKLTNYLPRFRIVNIDNKKIYISLYMYGSPVGENPTFLLEKNKNCSFFEKIKSSLDQLWELEDNITLFHENKWNNNWEKDAKKYVYQKKCIENCLSEKCVFKEDFIKKILGVTDLKKLNYGDNKPGFFTLDKISDWEIFISHELSRDIQKAIKESKLENSEKLLLQQGKDKVQDFAKCFLKNKISGTSKSILETIYFQEYIDILRRIYMFYFFNDPNKELDLYESYRDNGKKFAIEAISKLKSGLDTEEIRQYINQKERLKLLFFASVITGIVGTNYKVDADAICPIKCSLPLTKDSKKLIKNLFEIIIDKKGYGEKYKIRIDHREIYFKKAEESKLIISFPDDYIESIFLLAFYQELLEIYKNLTIMMVPKPFRIGNDITYDDVNDLLKEDIFKKLHKFKEDGRFIISDEGPMVGGLNIYKLNLKSSNKSSENSKKLSDCIKKASFLDVRGARSFEMAQNIDKDAFFSFVVCRPFSKYITGCEYNDVVIIYQPAKERSFEMKEITEVKYKFIDQKVKESVEETTQEKLKKRDDQL